LRQNIGQAAGFCGKKDDSDFMSLEVLLVLHSPVERQEDVKARFLSRTNNSPFFFPAQPNSGTV